MNRQGAVGQTNRLMRGACRPVRGFSLIELMIVVAVGMIAAAMVIISGQNVVRGIRLNESGASYMNLLQQARIRAVRDGKYYVTRTSTTSTGIPFAYVDIQQSGTYASGDPMMTFAPGVAPQAFSSGPGLSNLEAQFLPAGTQGTVQTNAAGPIFGPRGLPCSITTWAGGYTTCPYLTPTSYLTFLQNTNSGKWGAVTVTPAGRIRQWSYNGASWSPLN